jgi:hypothetical protein
MDMNAEMKEKLSKYMKEDGTYDVNTIAADMYQSDDDPLGLNATFAAYFSPDADHEGEENEMIAAAKAHNEALLNQREAEEKVIQDAILSADEIDWNAAEAAGMVEYGDEDDEGRPMKVYLKHEFEQRRQELRSGIARMPDALFNTDTPEENTRY